MQTPHAKTYLVQLTIKTLASYIVTGVRARMNTSLNEVA